ncbi:hypothetical protein YC2023_088257 [Brassica napus]
MCSGAGDAFSRRRGASSTVLVLNTILCFLFHCLLCLLPVRFLWIVGGSRSRRMLRWRRELRLFIVLLSAVLPLRVVLLPAMSREDSLAAALLWSSGSDPVVLPSGCRLSSQAVDLVLVDGVWTPTSLNVTILELYDVKAFPTHSSIVSNSLSSSLEDLSYLAYLHVCVYAYCKRRWIIPSCSCSEES